MEPRRIARKHADAQSRGAEGGTNLTDVLAADKRDAERYRACCKNTNLFLDAAFAESKSVKGKDVIDAALDAAIKAAN